MLRALKLQLTLFASTLFLTILAGAQAVPTATGPGAYLTLGVGASIYHVDYGQRQLGGLEGWVDYKPVSIFGIEAEVRQLDRNEDLGTHATTFLAGPRISRPRRGFEPYLKALAGSGHFVFPYNYARGNYLVVAAGGGVDINLGDRLRIRAIDLEYQRWPQFTFGSMSPYGVSAGISYALHRSETWSSR